MSKKPIICEVCQKVINDPDDLITASTLFSVKPYHEYCYGHDVRGTKSIFLANHPLNGTSGTVSYLLIFLLTLLLFFYTESFIKYIVLAYLILETSFRIYAYIVYIRKFNRAT